MEEASEVKADPRRSLPSIDRLVRSLRAAAPELPAWTT